MFKEVRETVTSCGKLRCALHVLSAGGCLRQAPKTMSVYIVQTNTNKRKQENQKRVYFYLETILVTALLLSTLKRPGMNWLPTHMHARTQSHRRRHLLAVNSNRINIKSQRPPCQGQTKADEINVLCCAAAAEERESGIVVVVCVQILRVSKLTSAALPDCKMKVLVVESGCGWLNRQDRCFCRFFSGGPNLELVSFLQYRAAVKVSWLLV